MLIPWFSRLWALIPRYGSRGSRSRRLIPWCATAWFGFAAVDPVVRHPPAGVFSSGRGCTSDEITIGALNRDLVDNVGPRIRRHHDQGGGGRQSRAEEMPPKTATWGNVVIDAALSSPRHELAREA